MLFKTEREALVEKSFVASRDLFIKHGPWVLPEPLKTKIVKRPIATSTMRAKLERGLYGEGNEGAAKLYEDILLMFDNCRLYNDDDEAMSWMKHLGSLPWCLRYTAKHALQH